MSDYISSITDLYNVKQALRKSEDQKAQVLKKMAAEDNPASRKQLQAIVNRIKQNQQQISDSISNLYTDPATDPLQQIGESNPLLLLPLRLETRFANSGSEIWIRVYPDEISIDSHEAALTVSEIKAGTYYWKNLWENIKDPDFPNTREKAWSQVANHFGANRATWIFLKTRPLKLKPNEDFSDILVEADLDAGPLAPKNQSWSEAAKCYVMPDLLKLRMYIGGNLVFEMQGNPIVQPLPVSPDPNETTSSPDLDWTGTSHAWMEDFDKAVEAGMGFKVSLPAIAGYNSKDGFSSIIVMGIRTLFDESPLVVPPPVAGARSLATLFENHQYTPHGLALVPQGTPTNNTEEKKSGYSTQSSFSEERYQQDLQQVSPSANTDEMEDGKILALALGLDPISFQKMENSQHTDHRDAVAMNHALYPATLGFFLQQLLNPLFKPAELETIRSFFCSYVTGRGPIPALRVGAQPYGILPTSNFKVFQWNAADKDYKLFQQLTALLANLDTIYEARIPNISKLGQPKDPHILLDEILELYANSETFYQRVGYSESFLRDCLDQPVTNNPNPLLDHLIKTFSTYAGSAAEGMLELKKIVWERSTLLLDRNRLVDVVIASESKSISMPAGLSSAVTRGENYIQWLNHFYGRAPFAAIEKDYYAGTDPKINPPILYLLLRHSFLIQLYKCVFHWLSTEKILATSLSIFNDGSPGSEFIASKEFLNFFLNQEDISVMELLLIESPNIPALTPGETAASYLLQNADAILSAIARIFRRRLPPEISNDFRHLNEFFPTLEYVSGLPTARLERAMIEHVDCLTYRLDAWQTALFYKKLELNRNAGVATGNVIGAYGWLENLKPASNVTFMDEKDLPKELQPRTGMPIVKVDDHGGYIHAPSLTQAKAAALLRNAYLHHHDPATPDMMAVNLDSGRVRQALELFEGMQTGHSINELLGYKLERYLHDQPVPLDKYIPVLREVFPLGGRAISNPGNDHDKPATTQADKPAEWVANLDGLAIVNAIKGQNNYPFGLVGKLPETGPDSDAIKEGITGLTESIDAMKDLVVAESIHQLVQGNTDRAGALLKSIHELKPPPKFESMQTPRTPFEILTHRACIFFKPADYDKPVNPWPNADMSPRASTEPGLNEWLGEIIGPPDNYQCTVIEKKSGSHGIISIANLNLQPIDLVYLVPEQLDKETSELSQRIAYEYRVAQNIPDKAEIEIYYGKTEKDNPSISDVLPLLKLLKEVVTNSKALDAADFDLKQYQGKANFRNLDVEKSGAGTIDIGALLKRNQSLVAALESLVKKFMKKIDNRNTAVCADMRECLIECCGFNLQNAFPKSFVGEDKELRDALIQQSHDVISQMTEILDLAKINKDPDEGQLAQSIAFFFGPAFKVLPAFHFTQNGDDEVAREAVVQDAYAAEKDIFSFITTKTNVPAGKHLQKWLNEILYLRPKLASFELTRLLYNSLQEKELGIHIMQLPYEKNDSWLGVEFAPEMQPGAGKLSLLIHHFPQDSVPDWSAGGFSGLLLDEWVEEIPGKEELTGISFQYNQPDSQPPQALLLAISPSEGKNWDWDKLSDIINDTFRRAKQRAAGTAELAKTDWIGSLPGALAEFSDTKANLSLFFRN